MANPRVMWGIRCWETSKPENKEWINEPPLLFNSKSAVERIARLKARLVPGWTYQVKKYAKRGER